MKLINFAITASDSITIKTIGREKVLIFSMIFNSRKVLKVNTNFRWSCLTKRVVWNCMQLWMKRYILVLEANLRDFLNNDLIEFRCAGNGHLLDSILQDFIRVKLINYNAVLLSAELTIHWGTLSEDWSPITLYLHNQMIVLACCTVIRLTVYSSKLKFSVTAVVSYVMSYP